LKRIVNEGAESMADMELIESIRRVEQDIRESRAKVVDLRDDLAQAVSDLPESGVLVEAVSEVKIAREKLKQAIADDKDCVALRDAKEAEASKLKDLREILSYHLVRYRETSQTTYIEEELSSKVRPIRLKAWLDKPEYHQEALPLDGKSLAAGEATRGA
jgi:hypothetical protein